MLLYQNINMRGNHNLPRFQPKTYQDFCEIPSNKCKNIYSSHNMAGFITSTVVV